MKRKMVAGKWIFLSTECVCCVICVNWSPAEVVGIIVFPSAFMFHGCFLPVWELEIAEISGVCWQIWLPKVYFFCNWHEVGCNKLKSFGLLQQHGSNPVLKFWSLRFLWSLAKCILDMLVASSIFSVENCIPCHGNEPNLENCSKLWL